MTTEATVAAVPSPQPDPPPGADHYFSGRPTAPSSPSSIDLVLPEGRLVPLATDAGVFSGDKIDPGTRFLLSDAPAIDPASSVLVDVGCGYGPIALALALRAPTATVWAVDVNERAVALTRANAAANGVGDRVRAVTPTDVPDDLVVDEIWSNPPIRIGKVELHALLTGWLDRLRPGTGRAHLVVHKHLGSDSLVRWLVDQGWPTTRLGSRAGYRILTVGPRPAPDEHR
jgi:16S rRNA (guanine1207-N2)-methyltransferase